MSSSIKYKIKQICRGWIYRYCKCHGNLQPLPQGNPKEHPQLIVSLTSYGRRAHKIVYYTLVSLFHQTRKPDKIVLWLDDDNFNSENIPEKLRNLEKLGLEINFCKDTRSFKKLIPSLKKFPDDIIITVDDDVIYPKDFIEKLYEAHLKAPSKILTATAREVGHENGVPTPYNSWQTATEQSTSISPVGFGGVLYPPHSLPEEVFNEDAFMKYCPTADDIWFFLMAKLKGTEYKLVTIPRDAYFGVDNIYQFLHRDGALSNINVKEGNNVDQLVECMKHYKLTLKDIL